MEFVLVMEQTRRRFKPFTNFPKNKPFPLQQKPLPQRPPLQKPRQFPPSPKSPHALPPHNLQLTKIVLTVECKIPLIIINKSST